MIGPIPFTELHLRVSDLLNTDGSWDFERISLQLPAEVMAAIRAMPRSLMGGEDDRLVWHFFSSGEFTNKTAYELACGRQQGAIGGLWSWIWKTKTIPRIQMFMWICSHVKLPTAHHLRQRGLNIGPECTICHQAEEDIHHILHSCPLTMVF